MIAVGGFGRTLQLATIAAGETRSPKTRVRFSSPVPFLGSRAPKRAPTVFEMARSSTRLLRIVRLSHCANSAKDFVSAALGEVSAAEWFRRVLEQCKTLLDSDPRLQPLIVDRSILGER